MIIFKQFNFLKMWFNSCVVIFTVVFFCSKINYTSGIYNSGYNFKLVQEGNSFKLLNGYATWISRALYKRGINETGFSFIEIETNSDVTDDEQAYGAGHIEGSLTYDLIYSQWYNTLKNFCEDTRINCTFVNEFIDNNTKWIKDTIQKNPTDPYWHHVKLYYAQMKGMLDGYNEGALTDYPKLTMRHIVWLNIYPEIMDIKEAYGGQHIIGDGHCSVLIKILPGNKDIYFGHNTWASYQSMLRLQKKYILGYKKSPSLAEKIPGNQVTFTSYPGTIASTDDFYLVSSGLAVTETTNEVFNKTLWKYISPENMVWESIRSVVANRLANGGESWYNIFKSNNSGTYNNQWMILDYKKFKSGQAPRANAFWVVEQIPSKVIGQDLTNVLNSQGYWSSYNVPYYKEIYDVSDYNSMVKKYGDWFTHDNAPRAKIFKRDHIKVHDMDSYMKLMRSNDFQHEPFAYCQCNPPYSAAGAIAARNDLSPANGTYQFKGQGHRPSGALDAKITNLSLFLKLQFTAVSGPTTGTDDKLPVFKWSTSNFTDKPHLMHPDVWNFKPVTYKWNLPDK